MNDLINKIESWDQQLFLFLNGIHSPTFDPIMYWLSEKFVWIPLYALILGVIIWRFKFKSLYILAGIGLVILFADQITSGFMKPFFERPRPCHEPLLEGLIYQVKGCGGKFGFASSHAANTFGLATFLWLLFKPFSKWAGLLFLWAALVSYSRIYLGVHYPLDIIVGGGVGALVAWLIYVIMRKLLQRKYPEPVLG